MLYTIQIAKDEDADQTAQLRRLICVFVVSIMSLDRFSCDGAHFIQKCVSVFRKYACFRNLLGQTYIHT